MKTLFFLLLFSYSCLLSVFGCQLSAVSGQQSFSETESWIKSQGHKVAMSQSDCLSDSATLRPYDFYESQIRLADSLYKNYIPQHNFEEVKAAMEFFDSVQLSAVSRQRRGLFNKKADNKNILIAESRLLTAAKAHYYHAVGLTERDSIVGACEHYLRALEIMEPENLKTSKSEKKSQGRKAARLQGDCLTDSATAYPRTVDRCLLSDDHPEDYEKIRFIALVYTRLGRLFSNENYCDLAIMKYKKALNYYDIINDTVSVSNIYKFIANSYQLLNKQDSALYYYKESLKISSCITNRFDIEKNIGQIMFDKGEKDSAYIIIKNCLDIIENVNVRYSYYSILGKMYLEDKYYDTAVYYLSESINSDIPCIKVTSAIMLSSIYDSIGDYDKKAYYNEIISEFSINDFNKNIERSKLQEVYDKYRERIKEKERIENKRKTNLIVSALIVLVLISVVVAILLWHRSKRKDKYIAGKEEIISGINEEIKQNEYEINRLIEIIEKYKLDIDSLKNELSINKLEMSRKETDIENIESALSIKKHELEKLQNNIEVNEVEINRLNEDNRTKEKQILIYIEAIEKLTAEINEARDNYENLRFRSSCTEGVVRSKNAELRRKEELLEKYEDEISNLKDKLQRDYKGISNLQYYLQSEVSAKIHSEIKELSEMNNDISTLTPLSQKEFVLLLNSANLHLNNLMDVIIKKCPRLKNEDLYYLCLVIIGLNNRQISSLFGVTYAAIRKRKNKIYKLFGLDVKDNLYKYLLDLIRKY